MKQTQAELEQQESSFGKYLTKENLAKGALALGAASLSVPTTKSTGRRNDEAKGEAHPLTFAAPAALGAQARDPAAEAGEPPLGGRGKEEELGC